MRISKLRVFCLVGLFSILTSCVLPFQIHNFESDLSLNFHYVNLQFSKSGTEQLTVATIDQRDYILNGKRPGNFLGFYRDAFYLGTYSKTASGLSLANEITANLDYSLSEQGFVITKVDSELIKSESDFINQTKIASTNKTILIIINKWHSEIYINTDLSYDLELKVFDKDWTLLAANKITGDSQIAELDGVNMEKTKHGLRLVFKQKLEGLMNTETVFAALN